MRTVQADRRLFDLIEDLEAARDMLPDGSDHPELVEAAEAAATAIDKAVGFLRDLRERAPGPMTTVKSNERSNQCS